MTVGKYNLRRRLVHLGIDDIVYVYDTSVDIPQRRRTRAHYHEIKPKIGMRICDILQNGMYLENEKWGKTVRQKFVAIRAPNKKPLMIRTPCCVARAHFFGNYSVCIDNIDGRSRLYRYNFDTRKIEYFGIVDDVANFFVDEHLLRIGGLEQDILNAHGKRLFIRRHNPNTRRRDYFLYIYDETMGIRKLLDIRDLIKSARIEISTINYAVISVSRDITCISVRFCVGFDVGFIGFHQHHIASLIPTKFGWYTVECDSIVMGPITGSQLNRKRLSYSSDITIIDDRAVLPGTQFQGEDVPAFDDACDLFSPPNIYSYRIPQSYPRETREHHFYINPEYVKMQWLVLYTEYKGRRVNDDLLTKIFSLPAELAQLIFCFVTGVHGFVSQEKINEFISFYK